MLQMMMEDLPPNLDQNPYYFGASHQQNHAPLTLPSYSYASPLESSSSESFSYQQGGNASSSLPNVGYYASQYMNVPKPSVRGFTTSSSRFQPYMTGSSSTFCTPLSTARNQISLNGQSGSAAGSYHPASLGNGNLVSSNGGSNNSNAFTNGFMHQQMIQETQGYQPVFNSNSNNNCNNSNFVYQSNGNAFYENQDTGYKSTYTTNNGAHPTTYSNQFTDNPSVGGFPQQTLQTNFGSSQNNLIMSYRSNSPDSFHQEGKKKTSPETKKRGTKKRKKKGGNEPTKPVSAYALFFKDTQAAIKAENSSATFGEISKIVASMWDSLSEEAKQVYKQKTEVAKRDYLKQLASFRANMISKGGILDAEEEDLQPLSVLREKMAEQRANSTSPIPSSSSSNNSTASVIDLTESPDEVLPPPPRLRLAPGASHAGLLTSEARVTLRPINVSTGSSVQLNALSQTFTSLPRSASPISMMTKIIVPGQNGAQSTIHVINSMPSSIAQNTSPSPNQTTMAPPTSTTPFRHIILRPLSSTSPIPPTTSGNLVSATPSPPPPIHLRSIVPQSSSPITILPNKPGQIIKVLPSESGGVTFSSVPGSVKGRVIKMVNVVGHPRTTSPTGISFFPQQVPVTVVGPSISQPMSVHQSNVQPILQMLEQESNTHILNNKAQEIQSIKNLSISVAQQENDPNEVDENALMQIPQQNLLQTEDLTSQRSLANNQDPCSSQDTSADNFSHRQCVRDGCINLAISCPYWDNEFCSNECVYSHCRDVFDGWVSARQVSGSVA